MEENVNDLIRKGINHALIKMNMQAIVNSRRLRELNKTATKISDNLQNLSKHSDEHSKDKFD